MRQVFGRSASWSCNVYNMSQSLIRTYFHMSTQPVRYLNEFHEHQTGGHPAVSHGFLVNRPPSCFGFVWLWLRSLHWLALCCLWVRSCMVLRPLHVWCLDAPPSDFPNPEQKSNRNSQNVQGPGKGLLSLLKMPLAAPHPALPALLRRATRCLHEA